MSRAMKLYRVFVGLAALACVLAIGCGGASTAKQPSTANTPVSTTRLMAADLDESAFAPKVGKPQHVDASAFDEEDGKKDESQRRGDRKPGGGFSGYK
jgi:hypothetical protein